MDVSNYDVTEKHEFCDQDDPIKLFTWTDTDLLNQKKWLVNMQSPNEYHYYYWKALGTVYRDLLVMRHAQPPPQY